MLSSKIQIAKHIMTGLLGLVIPVCFIYMDLLELSLPFTLSNAQDVYRSQKIYAFSSFVFPVLFFIFSFMHRKIKNQKAFYRSILNSLTNEIAVIDPSERMVYSNTAMKRKFSALDIHELLKQDKSESVWANDDKSFTVSISHFADYTILNLKDITAIVEKDKLIQDQMSQLVSNEHFASLGIMASGIAHEINNPMAIIQGNVYILRSILEDQGMTEVNQLKTIEKMITRVTQIINTMKLLARKDSTNEKEVLNLATAIYDVVTFFEMRIKKDECTITVSHLPSDLEIYANESQLVQIVMNLLDNAYFESIKEGKGWIDLAVHTHEDSIEIRIKNSGEKISSEVAERLFTPFFTTKAPGKGTGLGLSICKRLAEVNDGALCVDLAESNTCFVLRLPRLKSHAA